MKSRLLITLAAAGLIVGCGPEKPAPPPPPPPPAPAALHSPAGATNLVESLLNGPASTVLASVNGKTLTLGKAREEMDVRFAKLLTRVPAGDLAKRRGQALASIVDQFVMRTLLLEEADRRNIVVLPEEEAAALAQIEGRLPDGKTVEDAMKESPLGEARMREELLTGVRISKLMKEALPEAPVVSDGEVAEFVKNNPESKMPETISASHILIKTTPEDTDESKAAKRAKLEELRQQALAGTNFADLAAANSECPSRSRGGDLGAFRRGQMVKPFEDAAFSQEVGKVGDIVETKFGYHVILVTDKKEAGSLPREQIERVVKNRKSREIYEKFLLDLRSKADVQFGAGIPSPAETPSPAP